VRRTTAGVTGLPLEWDSQSIRRLVIWGFAVFAGPVCLCRLSEGKCNQAMAAITDWLSHFWHDLAARPSGPLAMRFYLQPLMATLFALRDGFRDAQHGNPAYFWALFTNPEQRAALLRNGWKSIGKVFTIAVLLDVIYQWIVSRSLHLFDSAVVATTLAIIPYLLFRGPVNRLVRRLLKNAPRKAA
jgi:hypothetical protein